MGFINQKTIEFHKISPDGTSIFAFSSEGGECNGLAVDANNYLYIAGEYTTEPFTFGGVSAVKSIGESYHSDAFIFKFDQLGNALWVQTNGPYGGGISCLVLKGDSILAAAGGLYISTNDGENWTKISKGLPEDIEINTIVVDKADIFLGAASGACVSTNNGYSFTELNNGLSQKNVVRINVKGETILAGTLSGGMFRSTDKGQSWTEVNEGLPFDDVLSIAIEGEIIYAATAFNGLFCSKNEGKSWVELKSTAMDQYLRKVVAYGNIVYVGSLNGLFFSSDYGVNFKEVDNWRIGEVFELAMKGEDVFVYCRDKFFFFKKQRR